MKKIFLLLCLGAAFQTWAQAETYTCSLKDRWKSEGVPETADAYRQSLLKDDGIEIIFQDNNLYSIVFYYGNRVFPESDVFTLENSDYFVSYYSEKSGTAIRLVIKHQSNEEWYSHTCHQRD